MLHRHAISPRTLDLLGSLSALSETKPFLLGGGTSLALRLGHRQSVDLDFFATRPFDVPALTERLLGLFTGRVIQSTATSLSIVLNQVKVDWLTYRYPLLREAEELGDWQLLSLPDVGAMKLVAVSNRGEKKDFFDIHALLTRHSLREMLSWYEEEYPNHEPFLVLRSLCYLRDAEQSPDPVSLDGATWIDVKETVTKAVRELA